MRWLTLLLFVLFASLQFELWVSDDGFAEVARLNHAVALQQEENRQLDERNRALEAEVADLKEGLGAVEERARAELGMIREGEIFYQFVESAPVRP